VFDDSLMQRGVATSLRGSVFDSAGPPASGPIEPPERIRKPSKARWYVLAATAIVGITTILVASGIGDAPASLGTIMNADEEPMLSLDGLPAVGEPGAKVTIIAVYDYACPQCEKARATISAVRAKYRGELRIVYAPYAANAIATPSALAACAAAKQGKFEQLDDRLWKLGIGAATTAANPWEPTALPDGGHPDCASTQIGCPALIALARELDFNVPRFEAGLQLCEDTLRTTRRQLDALGLGSIPAFFVNGRRISDPTSVDAFAVQIDAVLRPTRHARFH
jgi:protein-disulfide isomerase